MALLFETTDEIKRHVGGANVNNDPDSIGSYLDTAAEKWMVPILGRTTWDTLVDHYHGNSTTTEEQTLLPYVQKALANFAYYLYAEDGGLIVSDAGIGTLESLDVKRPAQWQVRDFKRNRLAAAWEGCRVLLKFLYTNKADYDVWWDSDERTDVWSYFIWDLSQWNKYRTIDGLGTLWALKPYMKAALEIDLGAAITDELVTAIVAWWTAADTNEDYELLKPYLERALVYCALVRSAEDLPLQIQPTGIYLDEVDRGLQNDESRKLVQQQQLMRVKSDWIQQKQTAMAALRNYLDENAAADVYAEYFTSDKYQVTDVNVVPDEAYTGGTFLM